MTFQKFWNCWYRSASELKELLTRPHHLVSFLWKLTLWHVPCVTCSDTMACDGYISVVHYFNCKANSITAMNTNRTLLSKANFCPYNVMNDLTWSRDACSCTDSFKELEIVWLLDLVLLSESKRALFSRMLPSAFARVWKEKKGRIYYANIFYTIFTYVFSSLLLAIGSDDT